MVAAYGIEHAPIAAHFVTTLSIYTTSPSRFRTRNPANPNA
jgi:hypothetical protein